MSPILILLLAGGAAVAMSSSSKRRSGLRASISGKTKAARAALGPDYVRAKSTMKAIADELGLGPDPQDWITMQRAAALEIDPHYDWPQDEQDSRLYTLGLKEWDDRHLKIWQSLSAIAWEITGYSIDQSLQ